MIFIDEIGHLISNVSFDELHFFANSIGLKRSWFQDMGHFYKHYDCTTPKMRQKAINFGAKPISSRELVKILKTLINSPQM